MSIWKKLTNTTIVMVLVVSVAFIMWGCSKEEVRNNPTSPPNAEDLMDAVSASGASVPETVPESDSQPEVSVPQTSSPGITLPPGGYIAETLRDGTTAGTTHDATLTPDGLQLHEGKGYVQYIIPSTPRGYVEFNARGFEPGELHDEHEFKGVLVTMWSRSGGYDYASAPYIFEFRKAGHIPGGIYTDTMNIRAKVGSSWYDTHQWNYLSWNQSQTYRFRVEWSDGGAVATRDGQFAASVSFPGTFSPSDHMIQIGANLENPMPMRWKESPHNIIISDVVIGSL